MRDLGFALTVGLIWWVLSYYRVLRATELALFQISLVLVVKWAQRHYGDE